MKSLHAIAPLKGEGSSQRRSPQKIWTILAAICPVVVASWVVVPDLPAQTIIPVSQTRTVQAQTHYDSWPGVGSSAVGFGIFNASVQSPDGSSIGPGYGGHGTASQLSEIGDTSITASGGAGGGGNPGGIATGNSTFSVTFDLATPCLYTLGGSLMWNTDGYWYPPVISLSGPTGTVFQAKGNPYFTTAFSTQGLLQSGEYVLSAQAQGVFYHFDGATFNLSFAVVPIPEPATWALLALSVGALLGILGRQQRQDRARLPTVGKTDTMVTPTG